MKLLVVTPYFYPKVGGMENYAWYISKGLQDAYRVNIVVVTSNHKENKYVVDKINGITIYRLPALFKVSNTPINPFWYYDLLKIITKEKPDIINAHTPVPFISDIAGLVAQAKKIPFVLTYQNDLVKTNILMKFIISCYYFLLGNRTGYGASIIITSSEYYANKSFYLKKFKDKVRIVPPGVAIEEYKKIMLTPNLKNHYKGHKVILFVGQLDKTHIHKGLTYLIQAMPSVKKQINNSRLIVIGKGNMISEYQMLAKSLAIQDSVEFKTDISDTKLVEYYKLSNVVVLPTTNASEGFGMVLIEAGACKKPVIGTTMGGIPHVITDKVTGYLIPPKDSNILSKKIIKILNDVGLQNALGENGYRQAIEKYSWNKQITKTYRFLKEL